jgi:branched-chain amino acid transport system permease protein
VIGDIQSWYDAHTILLILVMVTAVSALSYQVALRSGLFAFVSAGFWAFGAYSAANIVIKTDLPWPVGVLLGLGLSAVGGLVLSLLFIRLRGLYLGMATFAFDLVMATVAANAGRLTGGAGGMAPIPPQLTVPGLFALVVLLCAVMSRLEVGRIGRAQQVIRFDAELAEAVGVRLTAWRHSMFVLAAMLGSLAGSFYALTFYAIDPQQIGFSSIVSGVATVVIGGLISWRGCLIGALLVVGIPGMFQSLEAWEPVLYGGVLVLVAVFLPDGLFGIWQDVTRRRRRLSKRWREGST